MITNLCYLLALLVNVQIRTTVEATPTSSESRNDLKIICHYHLNTWYEPGSRDYLPEVIDESQCTHIVYNDRVRYTDLSVNRSLHDGKKLFYDRVPQFRKKGINVSISFFKFNGYEYAKILGNSAENRTDFVEKLVGFMERSQFNGFDVFWGCRSCSNNRNATHDEYFMNLMETLAEAFQPRGWLLSTFVSINEDVVHPGFDVQKLSKYVDWMAYHPIKLPQNNTSLIAPLYSYSGDVQLQDSSVNFSINYLIEKGVPPNKLVLSIASRGQLFNLQSVENNGLNAPAEQRFSEYFYELCEKVAKNPEWNVVHDPDKRIGTYAYLEQQWASYNDVEDVQHKAEYIKQNNLGGGSISSLNYDDFEGRCGCGKSPLLRALAQTLRNAAAPKMENCT